MPQHHKTIAFSYSETTLEASKNKCSTGLLGKTMDAFYSQLTDHTHTKPLKTHEKMYVDEYFFGLNLANKPKITLFEAKYQYNLTLAGENVPCFSSSIPHFVSFMGTANVTYSLSGKVIGLSKLKRIAQDSTKRTQTQERLSTKIANNIKAIVQTEALTVSRKTKHLCVLARGIKDKTSATDIAYYGGTIKSVASTLKLHNYTNT
jgi:GTP cyclohydrolase I